MPTLGEISEYIRGKLKEDFTKLEVLETLKNVTYVYNCCNGEITGALVYGPSRNNVRGNHIYFFCADSLMDAKELVIKGITNGFWPISAKRRGRYVFYKHPEKLLHKFLTL